MIIIHELKKQYGKSLVLNGMNAKIKKGEIVSIIGASGGGKTTLLRCINQLEKADSGQIVIDGKRILDPAVDLLELRKKVGMVFQSSNLFEHMMIVENIMCGPVKLLKLSRQEAYDEAMNLLEMVGLLDKAKAYPCELSNGQKQRAAIARTLAMHPKVLLFDEPTCELELSMVSEVKAVIRHLAELKYTMLIVTNEMKFAREISNRILYIDEGIVYEEGTPEQIFENPNKKNTRKFIEKIRTYSTEIRDGIFDFYGFCGEVEEFSRKMGIDPKETQKIQLLIEELIIHKLMINVKDINFNIEYSQKEATVCVKIIYQSEEFDPFVSSEDDLSMKIVKSLCKEYHYDHPMLNRLMLILN